MKKAITAVLSISTISFALGACGHDEPAKAPDNPPATSGTMANPPATSTMDGGLASNTATTRSTSPEAEGIPPTNPAPAERMPTDSTEAPLTDAQILQVAHVANQGEVAQAKLALTKTKDARVKKLANMMIKDHTSADDKGLALGKKDSIEMMPSRVSTSLESGAEDATRTLKGEAGTDFDKGYVTTQIKEHQEVLDTIDQKLLPSAQNADLKTFLGTIRDKVAMHLQHAKDLQNDLQK